jgi:Ni,Fe-hydrogenase III large subunit
MAEHPPSRPAVTPVVVPASGLLAEVSRLSDENWRLITASAIVRPAGPRVLYHFERDDDLIHLQVDLARGESVPSIGSVYPGSFLVENEMQEMQGVVITDLAIDYRGRLFRDFDEIEAEETGGALQGVQLHELAADLRLDACVPVLGEREIRAAGSRVPEPEAGPSTATASAGDVGDGGAATAVLAPPPPVEGMTVVPFGPQHPVLAEPIQIELTLKDEIVVEAVPGLGFVHRGIEVASESRTFAADLPLLERICGICSVAHAVAYAQAVENLAGVEIPRRARLLRTFWFELTRLHSHLLWLGLAADAIGFEALFQSCWRIREQVLDLFGVTAGNRVILGVIDLGGVRRDIPAEMHPTVLAGLYAVERGLAELAPLVVGNEATASRLANVAHISRDEALSLGLVGPTARASGVSVDVRSSGYAAHDELPVDPVVETGGDALARTVVRWREMYDSLRLCRESLDRLRGLPWQLTVPVPAHLSGEGVSRVEAPRGELFYYVVADGDTKPARVRVRTPTFANLAAVVRMLPGTQMAAVPVGLLSIDPCLSCTER